MCTVHSGIMTNTTKGDTSLRQRRKEEERKDQTKEKNNLDNEVDDLSKKDVNFAGKKGVRKYQRIASGLQRLMMFIFFLTMLSGEDLASGFGRSSGINRAHLSPLSVISCATQNPGDWLTDYRVKSAMKKTLIHMVVPRVVLKDLEQSISVKPTPKISKNKKKTRGDSPRPFPRTMKEIYDDCSRYMDDTKTDRGLGKMVKGNVLLIVSAFAALLGAMFGIVNPDYGLGIMIAGLLGFNFGIANGGGNGQLTEFYYYFLFGSLFSYYVLDHMRKSTSAPFAPSKKSSTSSSTASALDGDEWNDGFGVST